MKVLCPKCKKEIEIQNEHLGTVVACPFCSVTMEIPNLKAQFIDPVQHPVSVSMITAGVFWGIFLASLVGAVLGFFVSIIARM